MGKRKFEYEEERNKDIIRVFRHLIRKTSVIDMDDIALQLCKSSSRRFWVSPERASIILSRMHKGDSLRKMLPSKRRMFRELYGRAVRLKQERPASTWIELATIVTAQPAPEFYLKPSSAKVILYAILHQRRKKK